MKNFIYLLILSFVSFGNYLNACSCSSILSFCEAAASDSKIIEVEVTEKYSGSESKTYMDVKILNQLQGTTIDNELTIVSYGTSCDIFFDQFPIGQKLVVQYRELEGANAEANFSNFSFGLCSTSFLKLSNNRLNGNIEPDVNFLNYDDFKNRIGECADLTLFDRNIEDLDEFISISPNPTSDILIINALNLVPSKLSFELFNSNGQLMTSISNESFNGYYLDLSGMAGGFYFLRIKYGDAVTVKRIAKIN